MRTLRKFFLCSAIAVSFTPTLRAETFKIDPAHSTIGFGVHQFIGTTKGKFTQFSGTIDLDRDHPEQSAVETKIQVSSIDTGIRKRDDHLRSEEFFNVAKYSQITFKSRSVKRTGPQSGDIAGNLTMHGVTRPVILHVKLLTPISGENSRWEVKTDPLKRRDFGLMFSKGAEAISGIAQDVTVDIQIEASKAR
jgi:polyisoprenoid-binding protein YceI